MMFFLCVGHGDFFCEWVMMIFSCVGHDDFFMCGPRTFLCIIGERTCRPLNIS